MPTPNLALTTTVTPKILFSDLLAAGNNTIYTVAANKAAKLSKLVLCNTSGASVTVHVSVIPTGVAIDNAHKMVHNFSIPADDTLVVDEIGEMWVGDGDKVVVYAGTVSAVVATLNGLEFS